MGVSTNAVLFYGYCWDEPTELVEDDWEEAVAKKRGNVNPYDSFPPEIELIRDYGERRKASDEWAKANNEAIDKWFDAKKAIREEFGCLIGYHGSDGYSIPYITIEDEEFTARRGYPVEVETLTVGDDWNDKLEKFLTELGIEKPEGQTQPKWWLVSWWG